MYRPTTGFFFKAGWFEFWQLWYQTFFFHTNNSLIDLYLKVIDLRLFTAAYSASFPTQKYSKNQKNNLCIIYV